jgi:hypothetical protein
METMNIALPEAMKLFVQERVSEGGYSSVSEYVRDLAPVCCGVVFDFTSTEKNSAVQCHRSASERCLPVVVRNEKETG